jgi:hypothetical protein
LTEYQFLLVISAIGFGGMIARRLWHYDVRAAIYSAVMLLFVFNIVNHFYICAGLAWGGNLVYGMYRRVKG